MVPGNNIQQQPAGRHGFTKVPNEMFGRFKPTTSFVWIALHAHAWKRDGARPSIATIMQQTGLGRTAVKSAIRELVAAKVLVVTKRGDAAPNLYEFPTVAEATYTKFDNGWWTLGLDARQAMVLLAIQSFATMEFGAMPSRRELARMTNVSEIRLLGEIVPALEAIGVLEVTQRTSGKERKSNAYRIVPVFDIEVASYATPRGLVGDPPGSVGDPLVVPYATPRGSERDHEEDSYKKTELEEDSRRKTDAMPPRLRRAASGHPGEPETFSPGAPGGLASRMARYKRTDEPGTTGSSERPQDALEPSEATVLRLEPQSASTAILDREDDPLWAKAVDITNRRFPTGKTERQLELIAENEYRLQKERQAYRDKQAMPKARFSESLERRLRVVG